MAEPGIRTSESDRFLLRSTAGPIRLGLLADFSQISLLTHCFRRSVLEQFVVELETGDMGR